MKSLCQNLCDIIVAMRSTLQSFRFLKWVLLAVNNLYQSDIADENRRLVLQLDHIAQSERTFRRYHRDKVKSIEASLAGIYKSTGHLKPRQQFNRPHSAPAQSYSRFQQGRLHSLTGKVPVNEVPIQRLAFTNPDFEFLSFAKPSLIEIICTYIWL